jgi:predicted aldo/keto reductase-like oxidoreductase
LQTGEKPVKRPAPSPLPRRQYRDDVSLSIIGFGGILVLGNSLRRSADLVAEAFDAGINYFDVAPSYGNGEAEEKLGPTLAPYRDRVFLACKTMERTAEGASRELERSLQRMRTDHFDLYQFHAVTTTEDVEQIFAPDGAVEAVVRARDEGKVRFIGFSAHSEEAALSMLDRFAFDSILFPVNFICVARGNFGPRVLVHAKERGTSRLALKTLAQTPWPSGSPHTYPKCWYRPIDDPALAELSLRFTLSEDVTAALPPGDERLFRIALDAARKYTPLSETERAGLLASAANLLPLFKS